jgi:hypothetical protein
MPMSTATVTQEIIDRVAKLPLGEQQRVLDFVKALAMTQPQGVPGSTWHQFIGSIDKDDLELMKKAIDEECERIDLSEW